MQNKKIQKSLALLAMLAPLCATQVAAQDFTVLSAQDLQLDSVLPAVHRVYDLPEGGADSSYAVKVLYPEYTKLTRKQRRQYRRLAGNVEPGETPAVTYNTVVDRKQRKLTAQFTPVVKRDGKLQFISSFATRLVYRGEDDVLQDETQQADTPARTATIRAAATRTDGEESTYADHSVLASGRWAKIRVEGTGVYRLTNDVIRRAGFSDLSKVRVYGYGGNMVPERLTQDYLRTHDDLMEVATLTKNGEKYFYALGPVSWTSQTQLTRTRNPYSDYGYYFITQIDEGTPLETTEEELLSQISGSDEVHHFLYENDNYAWGDFGRRLVDKTLITAGNPMTVEVLIPAGNTKASVQVVVTAGKGNNSYKIECGGKTATGTFSVNDQYDAGGWNTRTFSVDLPDTLAKNANGDIVLPLTITATSSNANGMRLDYVSASFDSISEPVALTAQDYPAARYMYNITNQDMHGHAPVDMIIIIPTSQKLLDAATQIGELHKEHDGLTYRIVPADELYNEYSSGTPDVSAYRRYLKMFYDRAADETQMPKYVLLMGDAVWDHRLNTVALNADDYLLTYETYASNNTTKGSAIDDFITVLQDGVTVHADDGRDSKLQFDMAVGRIPVTTDAEAKAVVNKLTNYMNGTYAGQWQNEIMFIGDDGDNNSHMININTNAEDVMRNAPGLHVKKVMFDTYEKQVTSQGNSYPEVETLVKKQQNDGVLVMNYGGHASASQLAHEKLLMISDFNEFRGTNHSLWFAAACDPSPFDGLANTIGELSLLNSEGGAIGFVGAARAVYENENTKINRRFMYHVLRYDDSGKPIPMGEALRLAKNELVRGGTPVGTDLTLNKHQYHLIGDPALRLAMPRYKMVVDSIGGQSADSQVAIAANSTATVKGHVTSLSGEPVTDFNGTANVLVRDSKQVIVGRGNDEESSSIFSFTDRTSTLFRGTASVKDGSFQFSFKVPRDIYNDGGSGLITLFAHDSSQNINANGESDAFVASGWEDVDNNLIGPNIYAYLNSTSFQNGGVVGTTPYFVAELSDKDGINTTGASLGHNLELIVDGDADMTYDLDGNFSFDSDSYTSGQTYYVLPELTEGQHNLAFRAWDLLGNSNTVELNFQVAKRMEPQIYDVQVSPAMISTDATFYVSHDMKGSPANMEVEIIDPSGRIVQVLKWSDSLAVGNNSTTYHWTPSGLARGLYLYRVKVQTNGSEFATKTKKLILTQ